MASAFGYAAAAERAELFASASLGLGALEQMKRLLAELLQPARDAVSLLWLDAWQSSRRRPALLAEVVRQMEADTAQLAELITAGAECADFRVDDPAETAVRIMSLFDGLSIRAAVRAQIDYSAVSELVVSTVESELGLAPGALTG